MKKNLRSMIEPWQESQAQILVDMNQYDLIESTGMKPDLAHKKSAHMSAAWRLRDLDRVVIPMGGSDLSGVRYLTFSVCAAGAAGASFRLVFSNSHTGENTGGYETTVTVAKDGWNDYRLEIPFLQRGSITSHIKKYRSVCGIFYIQAVEEPPVSHQVILLPD